MVIAAWSEDQQQRASRVRAPALKRLRWNPSLDGENARQLKNGVPHPVPPPWSCAGRLGGAARKKQTEFRAGRSASG